MYTAKFLKEKKNISYFHKKKNQKYVLACILTLITSLLKSWELGQYFKNSKKIILFSFSNWGMTLYVRRIPDIKIFFVGIRPIRFYPII